MRRLKAVIKHSALGAGYQVALSDLEIRGAGSLFGYNQSGGGSVGFEYYSKKYVEILYRNHQNMLWKNDYANLFLRQFNSLKLKKKKLFINLMNNQEIDSMYLLKKK